jgi:hypothetical protein
MDIDWIRFSAFGRRVRRFEVEIVTYVRLAF